jgi:hypothetical protein
MIVNEILEQVTQRRPISRRQLLRHMSKAGVKPIGARQRPQNYPDDAAKRVLAHLGLNGTGRLPSMNQLRHERSKARRAA